MVPSQEEPAAERETSEAQPPGSAPPSEDAALPGPGPSDGPDVSVEKVEVELARSTGDEPPGAPVPPEGGWGWLVMLAAMWCNGSVFGIQNAYGVLYVSMLDTFGAKDDDKMAFKTAWVGSLSMGMIFFCCPIVSVFTDMFGCRKTAVVGAAVGFIGLMSSSFVSSIEPLYLTYGIIFACGCSFAYQPSLVILGHYFKKRLGLVNGIVTAGSSAFTILLPLLLRTLIDSVGLFHTLRVLCIFMFVLFLAGFTYRPLAPSAKEKASKGSRLSFFSRRKISPPKKVFNLAIFKVTAYSVWAAGIPLALFGYFVPYVHLVKFWSEYQWLIELLGPEGQLITAPQVLHGPLCAAQKVIKPRNCDEVREGKISRCREQGGAFRVHWRHFRSWAASLWPHCRLRAWCEEGLPAGILLFLHWPDVYYDTPVQHLWGPHCCLPHHGSLRWMLHFHHGPHCL
ncbi:monocarboxylate transporter 10 isoform X2 [Psammomys obesus]|uniref:monocarboxylate transporter 10 isoform X2 n=1 Tax=Psammomys obesus TaxID=48139 RepID=UPI0024533CBD|nr:monocarboxylate transporter 10 isoform X2 [Psammomys obesus]